jgi:hypothetical protein
MNSKKGMIKTVVAIFALIFLILVFILFFWLFKINGEKRTGPIDSQFTSLTADTVLKVFLKSPAYNLDGNIPLDMTPDVESRNPTNANLVAWTCINDNNQNYRALKNSINNFFNDVYGNAWELDILYSNTDLTRKKFGKGKFLEGTFKAQILSLVPNSPTSGIARAFLDTQREPGSAFQVLPCLDGSLAKIRIKAGGYTNIKGLKE